MKGIKGQEIITIEYGKKCFRKTLQTSLIKIEIFHKIIRNKLLVKEQLIELKDTKGEVTETMKDAIERSKIPWCTHSRGYENNSQTGMEM